MTVRAWQVLRDLPAWQITQIPRRPHARDNPGGGRDQADLGTAQRLQALVSAFHYGAPVGFGWIREQPGGPVIVLAAGPALAGAAEDGQVVLSFRLAPGPGLLHRARPRTCWRGCPAGCRWPASPMRYWPTPATRSGKIKMRGRRWRTG